MRHLFLLFICLSLQACTSAQNSVNDTVYHVLFESSGVELTDQEVQDLSRPSVYVTINDQPQIMMVLGAFENGEEKWVSQDRTLMTLRHGRLVKTLGWHDNLTSVSNLEQDPLAAPLRIIDGTRWLRQMSWTENNQTRYGLAESTFQRQEDEALTIGGKRKTYRVIEEQVAVSGLNKNWENRFWVDPQTGVVIKSEQYLGADYIPVEITLLKQRDNEKN